MHPEEQAEVRKLLNFVMMEGQIYAQNQLLSQSEFAAYWLSQNAFVINKQVNLLHTFQNKFWEHLN